MFSRLQENFLRLKRADMSGTGQYADRLRSGNPCQTVSAGFAAGSPPDAGAYNRMHMHASAYDRIRAHADGCVCMLRMQAYS